MVAMYNVFGRQVGSHWVRPHPSFIQTMQGNFDLYPSSSELTLRYLQLSMATLGALFAGSAWAMRGGDKKQNSPPINASSKDEENFIQYDSLTGHRSYICMANAENIVALTKP